MADPAAQPRTVTTRRAVLGAALGVGGSLLLPAAPALAAPGSRADDLPAGPALEWTATAYDLVLLENLSPPAAARVYAHAAVAAHEAVVAGMPGRRSLAGSLNGLPAPPRPPAQGLVDWPAALTTAVAGVLRGLLPAQSPHTRPRLDAAERDALEARRGAGVGARELAASREHGRAVAAHLLQWAAADGHAGTLGRTYQPGTGPAEWVSTPPNFRPAVEPYWSEVRPMVLRSADEVEPEPPVPFSTEVGSPFWEQAMATYRQSARNSDEHRAIARFWTDNPGSFTPPVGTPTGLPSGHWMLLGVQGLQARGARLGLAVETLALTGIALHDAFLDCWTWKYRFRLLRPITYLQRHVDSTWTSYVNTPQFPEHTSGHSVASPAAAAVLTSRLGTFSFTDRSHDVRGHQPRTFSSFSHAAQEAAESRLYGGIHFPHAIEAGLVQGERVGALVLQRVRTSHSPTR